jgi:hypothetical protein
MNRKEIFAILEKESFGLDGGFKRRPWAPQNGPLMREKARQRHYFSTAFP